MSSNFHPDGTLFIVSGPSGAGKTTLINRVREQLEPIGITLYFSVSHTTRRARTGEIDGISYHFVPTAQFESMAARGEFIEWAFVHEQRYGTSKAEVLDRLKSGKDVILDIDYQGARQIAVDPELKPRSLNIFIFPPSFDHLEQRLHDRGLNSEDEIQTRLQKAADEIDAGKEFYDYVIINDDLNVAAECLKAAIIAKKLQTKTALEAITAMAERLKEERDGRFARGH
ncbi:MAG: guanylate kinase [Acidobacteria bacterium]|nr:guanylate kinase [Acidobacteriota bacterium]MBV9069119.1 guanylate kinase [Acidobacteriota bacterium]MBV9185331.1 guanylate kinase [Acidobacteriota bacterium]